MLKIADKFKSIGNTTTKSNASSSIFGSAGSLAQSLKVSDSIIIGFYPIIDAQNPEIAMGMASCLCYLLEQYKNIRVYRVFAKIEPDDDDELDIDDSQFQIDQWEFEGLDDNIAIFGAIQTDGDQQVLSLTVDNSRLVNVDDIHLTYRYVQLHELINTLPKIASEIIQEISEIDNSELIITYDETNDTTPSITDLLESVFYWNLDLYLYLWDVEWDDDDIETQFEEMLQLTESVDHPFAIWCVSMMAKQVMQIGLDTVGDVIVPSVSKIFSIDKENILSILLLSKGLLNLGYTEQAIALIEEQTLGDTIDLRVWMTLIDIYLQANLFNKALDANQRAIELGHEEQQLYMSYVRLLIVAEGNDWYVEELLLIDPDEIEEDDHILEEIISALESVLEINPDHIDAIHTLIPYLAEVDAEDLWDHFQHLVDIDQSLQYVRSVIERLHDVDDLTPAYESLKKRLEVNSQQPEVYICLAQLAIVDEHGDLAKEYINTCKTFIESEGDRLDIELQQLLLSATYLKFEQQYSEIKVVLSANGNISERDVEFLEDAIEIAPQFGDLYATLTRCYLSWKDTDLALEVITDALNKAGAHPQLIQLQAQIYWQKGKKQEAFDNLSQALAQYPNDVLLLTQMANYLLDNNQVEDAKPFIEHAEGLASSHPALWALRRRIAEDFSE